MQTQTAGRRRSLNDSQVKAASTLETSLGTGQLHEDLLQALGGGAQLGHREAGLDQGAVDLGGAVEVDLEAERAVLAHADVAHADLRFEKRARPLGRLG